MAKIYLSSHIEMKEGEVWHVSNGATRNHLILVNKTSEVGGGVKELHAQVGFYEGNRKSLIFLNEPRVGDTRVLGIFLNTSCGYELIAGEELFAASSVGGPKNSESRFGVYTVGSVIRENSYANRSPASFWELSVEGWVRIADPEPDINEI